MRFQKGNAGGPGRPKISLNKPELLLPVIFQKSRINWAEDFARLYKESKKRDLTKGEQERYRTLKELLPYLCTKINVKDLEASNFVTPADKQAMNDQTEALIKALENDSKGQGKADSVEGGPSQIPPQA